MDQDQNTGTGGGAVNPPTPNLMDNTKEKTPLMFIGAGIVVLILLILGWYMMQGTTPAPDNIPTPVGVQNTAAPTADNTSAAAGTPSDAATVALSQQGTSDEVGDIDADAKATDLSSLKDIDQI